MPLVPIRGMLGGAWSAGHKGKTMLKTMPAHDCL